jgi:hypothetical protein
VPTSGKWKTPVVEVVSLQQLGRERGTPREETYARRWGRGPSSVFLPYFKTAEVKKVKGTWWNPVVAGVVSSNASKLLSANFQVARCSLFRQICCNSFYFLLPSFVSFASLRLFIPAFTL